MKDTTITALKNLYAAKGGNVSDVAGVDIIPDMINALALLDVAPVTVAPEEQSAKVFKINVSTLQSADTAVANGAITGTLSYISSGVLAQDWGAGNFLVLKFTASNWDAYDAVLVGLDPSVSSGLVDVKGDPDKNGVFKITDKDAQKFVVEIKVNGLTKRTVYDLSGLTLETA